MGGKYVAYICFPKNNKKERVKNEAISEPNPSAGVCVSASLPLSTLAAEGGFIEDTTATLQARNYYFSRDFSDIEGPNQQSKAEEWAQGFILRVNSGYTQGTVGFGVDLL